MKTKVIAGIMPDFEKRLNEFIAGKTVIDIKYSSFSYNDSSFSYNDSSFSYNDRYNSNGVPLHSMINDRALVMYTED